MPPDALPADISLGDLMGLPAAGPPPRPDDDHYRTPPECVRALLSVEPFPFGVCDPCAGDGIMTAVAADQLGADLVSASTLYPSERTYYPVTAGVDVLTLTSLPKPAVIINPPYSRLFGRRMRNAGAATAIIRHLLALLETGGHPDAKLCALLDIRFRLSETRNQPGGLLHDYPPTVIHAFQDRVTMYPPMDGNTEVTGGTMPFAWFIWSPPFFRPGHIPPFRADLNSRVFRDSSDRDRFNLPLVKAGKKKRKTDE